MSHAPSTVLERKHAVVVLEQYVYRVGKQHLFRKPRAESLYAGCEFVYGFLTLGQFCRSTSL